MSDYVTDISIVVNSADLGTDQYVRGEVYFTYLEQSRPEASIAPPARG